MGKRVIESPIPVVFKQILKKKISGELIINGDGFKKNMFFINGSLAFAKTSVIQERIGEILFKIGKIDQDQFLNITDILKTKTEKLGKTLIDMNVLSQKDLFFGLLYQVRTIATSVFSMTSGEWDFVQGEPDLPEDSKFGIDLQGIISEGMEHSINVSYYRNRLGHLAPKVGVIPSSINEHITKEDLSFLNKLKGFSSIPNISITKQIRLPDDEFWKKIIYYYLLNLVSFVEITVDKELDKNIEELIELFNTLKKGKLNYYQLFKIKNDVKFSEIKTIYFKYAKKFHPDRVAEAPDPNIKDKANYVFGSINKAYETLSNADKRKEYDSKISKGETNEDLNENLINKAKILYRKAITLHKQAKFWEATNLLDESVKLDNSKASYFLLLATCQMNVISLRRAAQKNFEKALELDPWNEESMVRMGLLFELEQMQQRAEGFFRKALSINPDNAIARKKLSIYDKSSKKKSGFSFFRKKK